LFGRIRCVWLFSLHMRDSQLFGRIRCVWLYSLYSLHVRITHCVITIFYSSRGLKQPGSLSCLVIFDSLGVGICVWVYGCVCLVLAKLLLIINIIIIIII
jgi:hypothetical protein